MPLRRPLLLLLAALLAGSAAHADTILRRGNHDEPETIDPHKSDGLEEFLVQSDMFIGLTKIDPHGRIAPDLAERWEVAPDGLSWTFHLRPHLKWSDGSPLTAEDFVWSLRRAVDPATAASYASLLYPIVNARAINSGREKDLAKLGVEAPDPDTVVVRLEAPTAYLAGVMTVGITFPVPRKAIEAYGEEWTRPDKIVCDGAFEMKDWVPQERISLVRNPNYYDPGSVRLDGVEWLVYPDDRTAVRSFRNGELDIARVPSVLVPWARKEMPAELHTGPNLWTTYLIANTQRAPLTDVRLRQALSMAIDRETIVTRVVPHGQTAAAALIPPGIEGYTPQAPDWAALSMPDRVARAKALVQAAGYGPANPLKIELMYVTSDQSKQEFGAVAAMWHAIGVDATLDNRENQVVESETRHHDFQISAYGWIADYPDPWTFLSVFRTDAGGLNTADYRNPEFDGLLAQASTELDPAKRMALLEQAERIFVRDQPVIPLTYDETPRLVSLRVKNYFDNALDQHRSSDIWLEPDTHPTE